MSKLSSARLLVGCMFALFALQAHAGARPYAFVQGTESLPQTNLEIESWFGAARPGDAASTWDWWLGPVVGITDQLEVGVFSIFTQPPRAEGTGGVIQLNSFRLQGSYLLAERGVWPVDVRLRVEFGQPVASRSFTGWFEAIASRDFGRANVTLNAGTWFRVPRGSFSVDPYLDARLGGSYQIAPGLRVGAEAFGETDLAAEQDELPDLNVGPSLAWGTGRIWLSAAYGFGVTSNSQRRGRIVMGLSF